MSFLLAVIFIFSAIAAANILAQEESKVNFPGFNVYVEGSYDPNLSPLNIEKIIERDTPFNYFQNSIYDVEVGTFIRTHDSLYERGHLGYELTGKGWRIHFATKVEAPVIDIWGNEPQGSAIIANNINDVRVGPSNRANSERDMGLSFLSGSFSYLIQNRTKDTFTSFVYDTAFAASSYNIFALESARSFGSNNLTVLISWSNTSTVTNLNATYAYNQTVFNNFQGNVRNFWWRLDLENKNATNTYIQRIEVKNLDSLAGRFILTTPADLRDERYDTIYIASRTSVVTAASLNPLERFLAEHDEFNIASDNEYSYSSENLQLHELELAFWSSVTSGEILGVGSQLKQKATNVDNEARGWNTASLFESAIKTSIIGVVEEAKSVADIKDMKLTNTIGEWAITKQTQEFIADTAAKASQTKNNIIDVVEDVKEKTIERVHFATDVAAEKISEAGAKAKDAKENTLAGIAAAKQGATTWGTNIKDSVLDTAGRIKDGAVSVASKIKDAVADAIPGINFTLIALIAGGVVVLIILMRYNMNKK
jgi:undecaprenyl pyrophosphate synthase